MNETIKCLIIGIVLLFGGIPLGLNGWWIMAIVSFVCGYGYISKAQDLWMD